jgi:microcystin-dependent protein
MEELMGTIKLFAGNFAPRGYAFCNGDLLSIQQYSALYSILGTTYGGNGTIDFALPDLRSRVPVGAGQGTDLSAYVIGQKTGEENTKLASTNIPQLAGTVVLNSLTGTASGAVSATASATIPVPCNTISADNVLTPENNVFGYDTVTPINNYASAPEPGKFMRPLSANLAIDFTASLPVTMNNGTGIVNVNASVISPIPVTNVQPVLGLNYIICIEGIYPSRP